MGFSGLPFPPRSLCLLLFLPYIFFLYGNQSNPLRLLLCNDIARKMRCLTPCTLCPSQSLWIQSPASLLLSKIPPELHRFPPELHSPPPSAVYRSLCSFLAEPGTGLRVLGQCLCVWRWVGTRVPTRGGKWRRASGSVLVSWNLAEPLLRLRFLPAVRVDRNTGPHH